MYILIYFIQCPSDAIFSILSIKNGCFLLTPELLYHLQLWEVLWCWLHYIQTSSYLVIHPYQHHISHLAAPAIYHVFWPWPLKSYIFYWIFFSVESITNALGAFFLTFHYTDVSILLSTTTITFWSHLWSIYSRTFILIYFFTEI